MFGLKTDFVQNGGTIMVLNRAGGIQSSELNHVQLGMIRSSRIPHFLKLHMKEVDYQVTLEYDITGKKMLSQSLKSERMTLTEYYGLLLQIATALDDSKLYMLQPENYILHEDYLFIEGSIHLGTLYLTYVPVASLETEGKHLPVSLKELMTRLLASVSELKGGGIQALMSYCGEHSFSLPGLKRLIVELLAGEDGEDHRSVTQTKAEASAQVNGASPFNHHMKPSSSTSKPGSTYTESTHFRTAATQTGSEVSTDKQSLIRSLTERTHPMFGKMGRSEETNTHADYIHPGPNAAWSSDTDDARSVEASEKDNPSPVRTYILLGCLLAAAGVWRLLYMNEPGVLMLGLSVGITLLLAVVAWLGWTGKLQLLSRRSDEWSGSLPMFESTDLSPPGGSKWKTVPRFQADPLSGLLTGNSTTGSETADAQPRESKENWRWQLPKSPSIPDNHQNQASPPSQRQSFPYSHEQAAEPAVSYGEEGDYYAQLSQRTEVLSHGGAGATVLLSPETASRPAHPHSARAYLELNEPNAAATQRIELNQPHFIIGRSPDVAQFIAQGVGTSRAHVELSREGGEYVLKDLGSRNGTMLKGESMVPYKEYPLKEGDAFVIAGWSFTLRSGFY